MSAEIFIGRTERAEDNGVLIATASDSWQPGFDATRSHLGPPTIDTSRDDPNFPPSYQDRFPADERSRDHQPLRLAAWTGGPNAVMTELELAASRGVAVGRQGGLVTLSVRWIPEPVGHAAP